LSALYGGRTDDRDVAFDAEYGVLLDRMELVRPSPLLSEVVSCPYSTAIQRRQELLDIFLAEDDVFEISAPELQLVREMWRDVLYHVF
jgi:hypothetical protein